MKLLAKIILFILDLLGSFTLGLILISIPIKLGLITSTKPLILPFWMQVVVALGMSSIFYHIMEIIYNRREDIPTTINIDVRPQRTDSEKVTD